MATAADLIRIRARKQIERKIRSNQMLAGVAINLIGDKNFSSPKENIVVVEVG